MVAVIDGVKQYTYYRKDFTEDERVAYNKYVSKRMCVFFKTEKGRQLANENNRNFRHKKKLAKLDATEVEAEKVEDM